MRCGSVHERLIKGRTFVQNTQEAGKQEANMKYLYVGMGSIQSNTCTCGMEEGRRTRTLRLCETIGIDTSSGSAEAKTKDK